MNWVKIGIVGIEFLISPVMAVYALLFILAIHPKWLIDFAKRQRESRQS